MNITTNTSVRQVLRAAAVILISFAAFVSNFYATGAKAEQAIGGYESQLYDPSEIAKLKKTDVEDLVAELKTVRVGLQCQQRALELHSRELLSSASDRTLSKVLRDEFKKRAEMFAEKARDAGFGIEQLDHEIQWLEKKIDAKLTKL